jgi:hypothetical protein
MLKKLTVGLQAVCLCVVVGYFTTEMMDNAKGIVGGWCVGDSGAPSGGPTHPPCHGASNDMCNGQTGCSGSRSSCYGGSGGGGQCVNTSDNACTNAFCTPNQKGCICPKPKGG